MTDFKEGTTSSPPEMAGNAALVAALDKIRQHVRAFYRLNDQGRFVYHTLEHTENVVSAAVRIAHHYRLNDEDLFVVMAACWFHDTGYYTGDGSGKGHEDRGAEMAAQFLRELQIPEPQIKRVQDCILATRIPQQPATLPEQIVCDADLFHLGTDGFAACNKLMRREAETLQQHKISKEDWRLGTIRFLSDHHYHTDYCRELLGPQKRRNIELLEQKAAEGAAEKAVLSGVSGNGVPADAGTASGKKGEKRPDRGIETVFRISSGNHQKLSDMADRKAHIMISTNSIIISVLLSVLFRKLEEYPHFMLPATLLLVVCVLAIVFSILAATPKVSGGRFSREDLDAKRVNLLFFGNFYRMSFEEYSEGMNRLMNDRDFLYGSLIRDVYAQGRVLSRKYRLLRIAYNVFMYGLIASVIAFIIAAVAHTHGII
ncbi:Pycsar system effector family protein [Compostibacter hankyongensis]|uniref:HD/PDEase domain-containing protein n=1 Tax=Compostibacter hankyongensis TaxID=1007089 RepID=A0ABP8GAX5_9BACT